MGPCGATGSERQPFPPPTIRVTGLGSTPARVFSSWIVSGAGSRSIDVLYRLVYNGPVSARLPTQLCDRIRPPRADVSCQRRARPRIGSLRAPACGGFTLLELLVVLSVAAAVAGLLLPALSRARRTANQVACAANLRQWGLAVSLYASQNEEYLPRRGQGTQPTNQINRPTDWFNALPPLLGMGSYQQWAATSRIPRPGTQSAWVCPAAIDPGGPHFWSYSMNMGLSVWEASVNNGEPDRITRVGDPSALVFLADGPANYCSVFPSATSGGYNPAPRHSGAVNICFLDGHVAAVPGPSLGVGTGLVDNVDLRWRPPGSTWNGAR